MKTIKNKLISANVWIEHLHNNIPSKLEGNKMTLGSEVGEGVIEVLNIQEGLSVTFINAKILNPIKICRIPSEENNRFLFNFYLSKVVIDQNLPGKKEKLGFNNYGILLSSAMLETEMVFPANVPINIFNISFSKEWLLNNAFKNEAEGNPVYDFLFEKNPICMFEIIDFKFDKIIRSIKSDRTNMRELDLFSNVLKIMAYSLEKWGERSFDKRIQNVNPRDIQELLKAKDKIEEDWNEVSPNSKLAENAGMSLSKFKNLFKQVFGKSPYQYSLTFRMDKAMELLLTKDYSVSEVGHLIGYSNLSQFSRIFKRTHSVLPSEVVR